MSNANSLGIANLTIYSQVLEHETCDTTRADCESPATFLIAQDFDGQHQNRLARCGKHLLEELRDIETTTEEANKQKQDVVSKIERIVSLKSPFAI